MFRLTKVELEQVTMNLHSEDMKNSWQFYQASNQRPSRFPTGQRKVQGCLHMLLQALKTDAPGLADVRIRGACSAASGVQGDLVGWGAPVRSRGSDLAGRGAPVWWAAPAARLSVRRWSAG